MSTYVLVHGAWQTGSDMEATAAYMRDEGHDVHCPTLKGSRPEDPPTLGLADAIQSLVDYLTENDLTDVRLMGHSYGGMVITGAADAVAERITRLVYSNAFVPNRDECLNDMVPPFMAEVFDQIAAQMGTGAVILPFPIWRDGFMNDASFDAAKAAYDRLRPTPYGAFKDKISLSKNPADFDIGKSYINCTGDASLPQSLGWHPRLSEKLGLFRLVEIHGGSHITHLTAPKRLAQAIMDAGRD